MGVIPFVFNPSKFLRNYQRVLWEISRPESRKVVENEVKLFDWLMTGLISPCSWNAWLPKCLFYSTFLKAFNMCVKTVFLLVSTYAVFEELSVMYKLDQGNVNKNSRSLPNLEYRIRPPRLKTYGLQIWVYREPSPPPPAEIGTSTHAPHAKKWNFSWSS